MEKSQLKRQLSDLDLWELFCWKREIQPLTHLLHDDENVLAATSGVWRSQRWMLVATDRRYLFVRANMIGGAQTFELGPADVSRCTGNSGWLFGRISLELKDADAKLPGQVLEGGALELRNVPKRTVQLMADAVEELSNRG